MKWAETEDEIEALNGREEPQARKPERSGRRARSGRRRQPQARRKGAAYGGPRKPLSTLSPSGARRKNGNGGGHAKARPRRKEWEF